MLCNNCREETKKEAIKGFEAFKRDGDRLADLEPSFCHDEPMIQVPYLIEDGRQYWYSYDVDINYCCVCGKAI